MKINIRYLKEKDIFEIQTVETKIRSHFLLSRKQLNDLRIMLEKVLLDSKRKIKKD